VDDSKIIQIQKRAYTFAYRLLRNDQDAEDYAQLAVIEAIERHRRTGAEHFKISWLVIECLRRELGRTGSSRSKLSRALRNAKSIIPATDLEADLWQYASEESLQLPESEENLGDSRLDAELIERIGAFSGEDQTPRGEALERGVTESRISQLRKVRDIEIARAYLWEHYKEYGIESELEIKWLTL